MESPDNVGPPPQDMINCGRMSVIQEDPPNITALRAQHFATLRDVGIMLNGRRRTTSTPMRGLSTAWLDNDDSGNYDPNLQRESLATSKRNKRYRTRNGRSPRRQRTGKQQVGYSFLVTLALTSEKGLNYLKSIFAGPPSSKEHGDGTSFDSQWDHGDGDDSGPRTRRKAKPPNYLGMPERIRADGLTIDQLTDGHPQKRGCKACFNVGDDECSLLEHAYEYPCTACEDTGIDCELIIPPKLKHICERCKSKRISCSYRQNGGTGVDACQSCEEADSICYAAPLKYLSYSRRYNDVLNSPPSIREPIKKAQHRFYASCNRCRENGLRCNLKSDQPGPCRHCKKNAEDCVFLLTHSSRGPRSSENSQASVKSQSGRNVKNLPRPKNDQLLRAQSLENKHASSNESREQLAGEAWRRGVGSKNSQQDPKFSGYTKKKGKLVKNNGRFSGSPSTSLELLGSTRGCQHIKIKTCFSHPIHFNYVPAPNGQSPCSWCEKPFFGLFGHGEIEVEVLPGAHGEGYEEVGEGRYEGHLTRGFAETTMCTSCTFSRVRIISCEAHEIALLERINPDVFHPRKWAASLECLAQGDKDGGALVWNAVYCSVCTSHAEWRCTTRQHYGNEMEEEIGCGLVLCQICKDLLEKVEADKVMSGISEDNPFSVLDRLINMVAGSVWSVHYDDSLRADAWFLTSTGELMQRINQGMGSGVNVPSSGSDLKPGQQPMGRNMSDSARVVELLSSDEDENDNDEDEHPCSGDYLRGCSMNESRPMPMLNSKCKSKGKGKEVVVMNDNDIDSD